MPEKLPKMTETEIDRLLKEQSLCRIAFRGKKAPYIAPFQYALVNDHLYFHFTDYGKKMRLLTEDAPVCVEIERYTEDLDEYRFVVLVGKLKIVTDPSERALAIETMSKTAVAKNLSTNFLVAHGFPRNHDWSTLTPNKPMVIVKLDKITEKTGLKSP